MRLAIEWTAATTAALVAAHLAFEIVGAAFLGYYMLFLLPLIGGVIGGLPVGVAQWIVLRRYTGDTGSWVVFTLLGFVAAWTATMVVAAVLFVPRSGLDEFRALVSFAVPTPLIGWVQARVLRRWTPHVRWWIVASALGWGGFFAVEISASNALAAVNQLAGRLVSGIAGYAVASSVGTTILGGAVAGAVTGIALSVTLAEVSRRA